MRNWKELTDESELVKSVQEGSEVGFKKLYQNYSKPLLKKIKILIPNNEVAEEILDDTFINVWQNAQSYQSHKGRLYTWILKIARNLAIDNLRSKWHRSQSDKNDIYDNIVALDLLHRITTNTDAIGLHSLITTLPYEQYEVLQLVYFNGFTHVEAAQSLRLPLGTVKARIRQAKIQLKKSFN